MKSFIDRVTSHALIKIRKQYKLYQRIEQNLKNASLKNYINVFIITMSFFNAHTIKKRIKTMTSNSSKLLFENVHSH